jgi:alginate O-acetyltransferase complex protein AlgI
MPFDTLTFVLFFLLIWPLDRLSLGSNLRKPLLLLASWLFYAGWNPFFLPMLIATSTLDWWLGKRLMQASVAAKPRWLLLSLVSNLGVLAFFKYRFFIADVVDDVIGTQLFAALHAPGAIQWALPVGISFYTFQSLSYCIDAYRGELPKTPVSWLDFSLYVAFFPQLVAGPIVRFHDFYPQLSRINIANAQAIGSGITLMIVGLFLKIVGADSVFAPVADVLFTGGATVDFAHAWLAALAFTGQIFCDFSGYSLCAIGAARTLGFALPDNFNAPYAAIGLSDFWRRWHISLSTWLRDYLYIPLGGNRAGVLRTYLSLSLTMLIGGLWHGAAWTFVIWGALHGAFLVIERLLRPLSAVVINNSPLMIVSLLLTPLSWLLTLVAVVFAWVFFRASDSAQALQICAQMLNIAGHPNAPLLPMETLMLWAFLLLLSAQLLQRRYALLLRLQHAPTWLLGPLLGLIFSAIVLSPGNARAFIYFQF